MSGKGIDLTRAIQKILKEYGDDARKVVNADIPKVAKAARRKVAAKSPHSSPEATGAYKRDWRSKVDERTHVNVSAVVFNKEHYQLTHLLEEGHVNWVKGPRNGTPKERDAFFSHQVSHKRPFEPAHPHITPVEEWANQKLVDTVVRDLEKIT